MEKNKLIQLFITIIIIVLPLVFSGKFWGFPDYWETELRVALLYCKVLCCLVGLVLMYRMFENVD